MKHLGCQMTPTNTLRVLATFPTKFENAQNSINGIESNKEAYPIVALLHPLFFEKTTFNSVFEYIRDRVLDLAVVADSNTVTDDAISKKRKAATHTVAGMRRQKRQKKVEDIAMPSSSRLPPTSPSPTWNLRSRHQSGKNGEPSAPAPAQRRGRPTGL